MTDNPEQEGLRRVILLPRRERLTLVAFWLLMVCAALWLDLYLFRLLWRAMS